MGYFNSSPDNATIQSQLQEEQEGKKFLDDLSSKAISCSQLQDADFEKIGEYVMGQSVGDTSRHVTMNEMLKRMMGESGEEQMHQVMGKRFSGCDTTIAFPAQDVGFIPMMGMMGSWFQNSMMNFGFGYMPFGWIFMVIFWILILAGIVALVKLIMSISRGPHQSNSSGEHGSSLKILKERYAKGEIDKKEFDEKKKDLL